MPSPRILVFRGGALGDFILTLPALRALRGWWPDSHVELVCRQRAAELAKESGLTSGIRSLESAEWARLFAESTGLSGEQAGFVRSFDVVVSWLHDPDGTVRQNLQHAGARRLICGSPIPDGFHGADQLMRPLESLGIPVDGAAVPALDLSGARVEQGRKRLRKLGERVVAIHPGSGSPAKNWPLSRFVELARTLRTETSLTPMFTFGEADERLAEEFDATDRSLPALPRCDVTELAGVLAACAGYIGNDSGVTHLAAALGIPVVAVFGPTDPDVWGPRGARVRIVRASERTSAGLAAISVEEVLHAAEATVGCILLG